MQRNDLAALFHGRVQCVHCSQGIGVKTQKFVKAGEYIVEYVGEVVTDKEFKNRMTSLYKNDIHHYCLNLEGGLLIDGHRMGSDGECRAARRLPTYVHSSICSPYRRNVLA